MMYHPIIPFLLSCLLLWGNVGAQTFQEGTEILMTDPANNVIVGHGLVVGGQLELSLSGEASNFVVTLIQPDNSVEQFQGRFLPDGRLSLLNADGTNTNLADIAAGSGLRLRLMETMPSLSVPEPSSSDP